MRAARAEVRAEMLEARRSGGLAGSEEAPDAAQALQEELERVKREARAEAEAMRPALFSEALENITAQVQAQAGGGEEAEGVDEGSGAAGTGGLRYGPAASGLVGAGPPRAAAGPSLW